MGLAGFNLPKVLSALGTNFLQTIVNRGHIELYRHLWDNRDFHYIWTADDFTTVLNAILSSEKLTEQILEFHLQEGSNHFLAMGAQQRQQIVNWIYNKVQPHHLKALAQSFYSPFLLIELIDKQTFAK